MTSTTLREMLVKQEPRNVSTCYVCAGPRAEYLLSAKPSHENAFFPFLETHHPPEGAESMRSDGKVLVCVVCYMFLNQQWDSFERNKTPFNKRIYWLKRLDGGPFAGMDANLQQDYESLFESSNAATETDSRAKPKQSRNRHSIEVDVAKSKQNERIVDPYSKPFNFASQVVERTEPQAQNILDLSMPARAPSRSSNSASPGVVSEVCYTCGQESKTFTNVFIKYVSNSPFYLSLAAIPKPPRAKPMDAEGRIHVCGHCHVPLLQQWEYYQKRNIPHHERFYRILNHIPDLVKSDPQPKEKSFVCYTCGMVTQFSVQRFISAYPEKEGEPFFSFLLHMNPHPGANKLNNGKASVCSVCYKNFGRQFRVYELSKIPEEKRKYKILNESVPDNNSVLRQHLENTSTEHEESKSSSVCYLCESVSDALSTVNSLPMGDMYFPFIKGMAKPSSALPMDGKGRVKVCSQCLTSLTYQWNSFEQGFIPINQRQYKVPGSKSHVVENHYAANSLPINSLSSYSKPVLAEDEYKFSLKKSTSGACSLCDNVLNLDSACFLETLPRENCMYFPTIRSAVKPGCSSFTDQYGRILACSHCFSVLKTQWEIFESARVPHSQRQYEILPPKTRKEPMSHYANDVPLSEPSTALHIQVSSPDLKVDLSKHSSNVEPLLTTVTTLPMSSMTISNAPMSNPDNGPPDLKAITSKLSVDDTMSSTRICGPLDVPFVRPLLLAVPIYCYVCGEYNSTGVTYSVRSQPHPGLEKTPEEVPFFPFLSKHPMPEGAEKMKDGNALVCMFCYHSLISQWLAYEMSNNPEDENKWLRRYNSHNYVCYICGITTYRKRVCSISVKEFPFLLEHKRPAGALTVFNGECVVTCQTCFESITSQFKDFERMKVPVEMRKYNWITVPPPPDDENSRGCQILQENSGSLLSLPPGDCDPSHLDESGIPHGLKPSSSHLSVPTPYGVPKSMGRNVISPVHQGGPHANSGFSPFPSNINPALNATRASSFAAALRKLAKQAVDPIADKDLSPATSPASSQQSGHGRHHMPMYMNSHSSNPHGSPSPIVPPPLQNSQGKALDLGRYSNSHRNGSIAEPVSLKMDNSKLISSSSSDKRNEVSSGSKHMGHHNMPPTLRQEHSLSRGFQPYRNSEERRSTPPQMYNPSPPPNTMSGYVYHPSYVQSSRLPPQSYRLEENAYMERYGLLRPSTMPYPPPSNMIPHPRAPMYSTSQYPPELIPQSVRTAPGSTGYPNSRYNHEEDSLSEKNLVRKREMELYREHERHLEQEEAESREREAEYMRKERAHMRQSPLSQHHPPSRQDVNNEDKGLRGSITHGTPRDYQRGISPPPVSTTTPLNLATSLTHAENHMAHKEDYRHSRHPGGAVNGQLPPRKNNHQSYRKENDPNLSYRMHYPPMNVEKEQKPPISMDTSESSLPAPSRLKPTLYYTEQDGRNQDNIETRTFSIGAVINSKINGIFSREKIACNTNFGGDYGDNKPPKFQSSKTVDSEIQKLFSSGQEPYYPSNNAEKPLQSLSGDVNGGSVHQYKLGEHPSSYFYQADPYRQGFGKPNELQQPRTLLQEHPVPMSYENEMHPVEEPPPRVVSILDAREAKLRKKRAEGLLVESDESGIESDEEDSQQLKRLLSIRSVSPIKLEPDPKKTNFLSKFDLVTHSKKFDIEITKYMRRHKLLREKSASPVENESPAEEPLEYDPKHLWELSDRLCLTKDFQPRTEFMKSLGLMFLSPEQKTEKEKIRKICQDEKLRRCGILKPSPRCLELQGSQLGKRDYTMPADGPKPDPAKKPNLTPNEIVPSNLPELTDIKKEGSSKESKPIISSVQRLSSFMKPPMRTVSLPVPPLIPTYQVMPPASDATPEKSAAVVAAKDPRVRQLNKEFAQEFHNSVLQTTQMQLEKKTTSYIVPMETSLQKSPSSSMSSVSERLDWSPGEFRLPPKWPGIEAIMESYECHISEQNVEKKFLLESCQKLKTSYEESYVEIDCITRKTEELMQEKKLLDSQARELQINIENLKLFIRHFR